MAEKSKGARRARNFVTVVYPESAPENWLDILTEQKIPAFVSPLHNLDVNPTGEVKKEHHHVMLMFEGKKSEDQVKEIFALIGGVGLEVVQSLRGCARYLCHLDNPEKAQYREEDVRSFCGADYPGTIGLSIDKYKCIKEMIDFCIMNDIVSYSDLLEYSMDHRFEWFRILCDCGTVVVKEYLKARAWTFEYKKKQKEFDEKMDQIEKKERDRKNGGSGESSAT